MNLLKKIFKKNKKRRKKYSFFSSLNKENMGFGSYSFSNTSNVKKIGNYCSIGYDVRFITTGDHFINSLTTSPFFFNLGIMKNLNTENHTVKIPESVTNSKGNGIVIKHDVWIGQGAIILDNVTIETGAIIGAGAIVTKDIPPYAIVVGSPAKIIKYRFNKDTINILLKSKWWNMPTKEIAKLPIFDINKVTEEFKGYIK